MLPNRAVRSPRSQRSKSAIVRIPAASSAPCVAVPTPQMIRTGLGVRKACVSACPITENPRGLSRSDAILAKNLLWLSPTDPDSPSSTSIRRIMRAISTAGGAPCSRAVPVRSMNASSSDRGSIAGVNSSIIARIWRLTAT